MTEELFWSVNEVEQGNIYVDIPNIVVRHFLFVIF